MVRHDGVRLAEGAAEAVLGEMGEEHGGRGPCREGPFEKVDFGACAFNLALIWAWARKG